MPTSKEKSIKRELCFSEPFLQVEYLENVEKFEINRECILLNLSDNVLDVKDDRLDCLESSVYSNVIVQDVKKAICIQAEENLFSLSPYSHKRSLTEKWTHVYDIFPYENLKDVNLWRSSQDKIDGTKCNLWYAPAGTDCGIHNEHDFIEIHTQVYGIGSMQKFVGNNHNTLYQNICMAPGNSHKKFCNDKLEYPWHQYYSQTDCIWLVVEFQPE